MGLWGRIRNIGESDNCRRNRHEQCSGKTKKFHTGVCQCDCHGKRLITIS